MYSRKIRVCFVFRNFYPVYGGAGVYIQKFIPHLREVGIDAFVLTAQVPGLPINEIIDGIEIRRIKLSDYSRRFRTSLLSFNLGVALHLYIHRKDYDIVHFGDGSGGSYFTVPLLRILGKPIIIESVLIGSDDGQAVLKQKMGRCKLLVIKHTDAIIGLSDAIYQSFLDVGMPSKQVHIVPYGIDSSIYRPAQDNEKKDLRISLNLPPDDKIIVFVGGINRRKGVDILVRAMAKIVTSDSKVKLLLVGPRAKHGYQEFVKELDNLILQLGLQDYILFTDQVSNVVDFLRTSDIYATASHNEGLGLGVMEAMACGLPCVCARLPGITDMIFDTNSGIVLDEHDEELFADNIIHLLDDERIRKDIGSSARNRITELFKIHNRANIFRDIYTSVILEKLNR